MARARQIQEGEIAGALMAFVASRITGEQLIPSELNPFREPPKRVKKSREQLERESKVSWDLLDRFMGGQSKPVIKSVVVSVRGK